MAANKISRKSSKFRVVFTVPDYCWLPSSCSSGQSDTRSEVFRG